MNYLQHIEKYGLEEGKRLWTELTTSKRVTSGFAAMTKEQRSKIASMGGTKSAQNYRDKLKELKESGKLKP